MANKRSKTKEWLKSHLNDPFVIEANKIGVRSRAFFKLKELNEKDAFIKQHTRLIDLGSAPGSWSEYASSIVTRKNALFACDLLEMDPIANVSFIQGDFRDNAVLKMLCDQIGSDKLDVVLSDMSPNLRGVKVADQVSSIYLLELALAMCDDVLNKGGFFICKAFHGIGSEALFASIRAKFKSVKFRKPLASRSKSKEFYIVASGFQC